MEINRAARFLIINLMECTEDDKSKVLDKCNQVHTLLIMKTFSGVKYSIYKIESFHEGSFCIECGYLFVGTAIFISANQIYWKQFSIQTGLVYLVDKRKTCSENYNCDG